ncbi:MAG: NAD(P)H-hydrate dehydratase [Planctomycetales bacterium]|nr:NAD(P)H-hydrate dehydratase [Planctomycetales bacterium]MBN8624104.1 NAD(P)H-hydrate dehydratase [Planctomycetota bacterium]
MIEPAALTEAGRQVLARASTEGYTLLKPRENEGHKGTYGRAVIVGGSLGMAGAVGLSGMACLRGGAGLVRLAVPRGIVGIVAAYEPAYMTAPLDDDEAGRIARGAKSEIARLTEDATAVAVGPGQGRSEALDKLVLRLFGKLPMPAVFDADALNALAEDPESLRRHVGPRILTPHPGEFRRLIGAPDLKERGDMCLAAKQLAAETKCVVVLKGHATYATDGDHEYTNTTGNPGMATGGTGDVLTGLLTALLCQGLAPFDAARLGVFVHGLAGDLAAADLGMPGLIASDLVRYLPQALRHVIAT